MRLRTLLDTPRPGLELVTGAEQLDREIRWVVTTDLPDPGRYLSGQELVLTGLVWRRNEGDAERFVAALEDAGASGMAAGVVGKSESGEAIPDDVIAACRRHRIPLFRVPADVAFASLTEHLVRQISAQRAGDISSVLDRHRRMVSASASGPALDPILELIASDLGMACWVLAPDGRAIAGSAEPLAAAERAAIAAAMLRAPRLPLAFGARTRKGHRRSVFAIPADGGKLAAWYLVIDGDHGQWAPQRLELASEVAAVLALERHRLAERDAPLRHLADELVRLLASGGEPAEITSRMRIVGLDPDSPYQAVAVSCAGTTPAAAAARGILDSDRDGFALPLASFDDHCVVLVPAAESLAEKLRLALATLTPGLGRDRVAVGVSDAGVGVGGLRAAIESARNALRVGEAANEQVSVVDQHELASHVLLLASVPDDVRVAYRDRLLGPLLAYDAAHRSDLEATLESFLACSMSWTRCAEAIHIHVNTLRYRISRIEELTGRDFAELETQVDFFLALRLR